ncbi:unnamed protein product [Ilex paraguariensis]|uniref:FAR1 domain-containing protein n=1 Tax=Ilex paraguariensis TaxID=185542 RepID=A0ABC8UAQ0_9AQUA
MGMLARVVQSVQTNKNGRRNSTNYTSTEMDGNTCEKEVDNAINVEEKLEEPKLGMVLNTVDEIMEYYIRYGNGLGFPIKRRTLSKGDDGELKYVTFACSR